MSEHPNLKGIPGRGIGILRHIVGLTQPQLAERTNLSPAIVSHIELGTRQLCDPHLHVFAAALKCSKDLVRWARGDDLGVDKEFALGIELAELFRKHTARSAPRAVGEKWAPSKPRKIYPRDLRFLERKRRQHAARRLRASALTQKTATEQSSDSGGDGSPTVRSRRGAVA